MSIRTIVAAFAGFCAAASSANADLYLNGALSYFAMPPSGHNQGGATEYDSFATPNTDMLLNGATATPILLAMGDNVISVAQGFGSNVGLGLFFSADSTLISGPSGRPADLVVYQLALGGPFAHAGAGTMVATFGQFSGDAPYSGATSYSDGVLTATVTAMDVGAWAGTITINVVPAPAGVMALGIAGLAMGRRRR